MKYTQENRLIAIDTPLGKDVLLLAGFTGTEGVSMPFSFELDLLSQNHDVAAKDIIGKKVTISVTLADGSKRFFNGIVSRFSQERGGGEEGPDPLFSYYSATMVPWFWLLAQTSDSRIFQNVSVPDIVEKIFGETPLADFKKLLEGTYEKREYCVQYRETDFNFISRLLEEEGIFYFFEHNEGSHTLVLADSNGKFKDCPKQKTATYQISTGGWLEKDVITGLEWTQEMKSGKCTLSDYNFKTPTTDLKVEAPSQQKLGPGEREIYDYPGGHTKRSEGERLANIRMQEEEAEITTITGSSVCRAFTSGYRFTLEEYFRDDMTGKPYVLTSVEHEVSQGGDYSASSAQSSQFAYTNDFTCIPFDVPYRPPRDTPKPVVEGVQTAIVVGPAGEEIYTDEHGRVKVQFHWDREGKKDEKSSCWIRVGQLWAAAGWGGLYIPRIGQEVIVHFLEGDPDRPIIIGCVYHGNNKPPYALPAEKTKSTIKSNSSLGGGGYNELRFEDKKGEEEIYLHGQKDWTITIENDKNQSVGHDESLSVGNNRDKTVGVNQSEKIGSNKTISVGGNHTETIAIAKALTIGAAYQVTVGAAMNQTVGGAKAEEIGAVKIVAVGAHSSEKVGKNKSVHASGDVSETAGKDVKLKSGKKMSLDSEDDFSLKGGKKGIIDIADELIIRCGGAKITLKKNGDIEIKGKKIEVKGQTDVKLNAMKISSEAKTKSLTKGAMVNVEASGINTIKGALVKIN